MLKTRGFNHIDLGTKDMEATRAFYEDVLGFPLVRADLVELGDEGPHEALLLRRRATASSWAS